MNRLAATTGIDLTVFAGQDLPGVTNTDASDAVTARIVRVRNVWRMHRGLPFDFSFGWTRMLRPPSDVVIVSEATRNLVHWLLLVTRRVFSFKLVVMGHISLRGQDRPLLERWRRRLVTASDGVIAYTDEGLSQAIRWGVPSSSAIAMGNTMDVERVAVAKSAVTVERVDSLRTALGLEGSVFLFIARPTPWKRLDVAIDAVQRLSAQGHMVHLLVVGAGVNLPVYVQKAADLPFVHFLGEIHDEEELAPIFAVADLVLIPGAVGLAVNHAFAYGVPLVTARGPSHGPEMSIAEHGRNAWFVDACTVTDFATALSFIVQTPTVLASLRKGAADTAVPTTASMADNIAELVTRVATERSR